MDRDFEELRSKVNRIDEKVSDMHGDMQVVKTHLIYMKEIVDKHENDIHGKDGKISGIEDKVNGIRLEIAKWAALVGALVSGVVSWLMK